MRSGTWQRTAHSAKIRFHTHNGQGFSSDATRHRRDMDEDNAGRPMVQVHRTSCDRFQTTPRGDPSTAVDQQQFCGSGCRQSRGAAVPRHSQGIPKGSQTHDEKDAKQKEAQRLAQIPMSEICSRARAPQQQEEQSTTAAQLPHPQVSAAKEEKLMELLTQVLRTGADTDAADAAENMQARMMHGQQMQVQMV